MNPKAPELAQAIAKAEGFFVPNSLPARCHNPGDLEVGSVGYGVDNGKTIFKNDDDGWMALQHECDLMLTGHSHVYRLTDSILTVASKYTGNDHPAEWAAIVAGALGISVLTTLQEFRDAP